MMKVLFSFGFQATDVTIATIQTFFCFQTRLIFLKSGRKLRIHFFIFLSVIDWPPVDEVL